MQNRTFPLSLTQLILLLLVLIFQNQARGQCMTYAVPLSTRITGAERSVIGTVGSSSSFYSNETQSIWTLHQVQVDAYLKQAGSEPMVGVLTPGGKLENQAEMVFPSLTLEPGDRVALFLDETGAENRHPAFPGLSQYLPTADAQGALRFHRGKYYDLHDAAPMDELTLLTVMATATGQEPVTPEGRPYRPRTWTEGPLTPRAITTLTPNPAFAGTVNPTEFLTITGSGFGASPGTVEFANADDGGATAVTPPNTSDYVYWADDSIVVKIPRRAGTGDVTVNGSFPTPLTIRYSHLEISSNFSGFSETTRQRYYLRNLDGAGGYTFTYNTDFESNASAKASFDRALETWRCATYVNFKVSSSTSAIATAANDGVNIITFDASLPLGVLGRATSRFTGSAIPTVCDQENTVWWLYEVDMQFNDPPFTGFTWNFGPGATGGSSFDFESVAVHELGHAHGLGHVISSGEVMHYALFNGADMRSVTVDDIAGGTEKIAYSSVLTCFDPSSAGLEMTPLTAGGCVLHEDKPLLTLRTTDFPAAVTLEWTMPAHQHGGYWTVERMDNSSGNFVAIHSGPAGNGSQEFTDQAPPRGAAIAYRIRLHSPDGYTVFSNTEETLLEMEGPRIWYSNASLYLSGMETAGSLQVWGLDGRLYLTRMVNEGTSEIQLPLATGLYFFRLDQGMGSITGKFRAE
jgi:hypothetical protein